MPASQARYSAVAIACHWAIALLIAGQIVLGWRMGVAKGAQAFALFQLHKSSGITILLLSVLRLAWRLFRPPPPPRAGQPRWEAAASGLVHFGFYVIMIGLPLTGWLMVSTSRIDIPTLLYGTIPWPHLPFVHALPAAAKGRLNAAGETGHWLLVWTTVALLALHLGAVAKHQLLDRDAVFARMAPGARPGWREPRLWLVALAALGAVALAFVYVPASRVAPAIAAAPAGPPAAIEAAVPPAAPAVDTAESAAAETAAEPAANVAAAEAEPAVPLRWAVRPGASLRFTARWSGDPIVGSFKTWDADILFSPDALDRSSVRVTVDLASASTGDAQRDTSLPGSDWFDVATHPRAVFAATNFRRTASGRYRARGTLSLRGLERPLTLDFALTIKGARATVSGGATLDRTAFGVGQGEWAATDQIAAAVAVAFTLSADRR